MPALEVTEYSYPQHSYVSLSIPIRYAYCFCVVAYGVLCIAGVSCNMSLMHCLHVRVAQSCRKVSCARMAQSQRSLGALPPEQVPAIATEQVVEAKGRDGQWYNWTQWYEYYGEHAKELWDMRSKIRLSDPEPPSRFLGCYQTREWQRPETRQKS